MEAHEFYSHTAEVLVVLVSAATEQGNMFYVIVCFAIAVCAAGGVGAYLMKYYSASPSLDDKPHRGKGKSEKEKPVKLSEAQIKERVQNGGVTLGYSKYYKNQPVVQDVVARKANTLFIGPNGVGKTNHILSTAIKQDIQNPNVSPVIFDGKNSRPFVGSIVHMCKEANREVVIFPDCGGYNPLGIGETPTERATSFSNILSLASQGGESNPFFLEQQQAFVSAIVPLFEKAYGKKTMVAELRNLITSEKCRKVLEKKAGACRELTEFKNAFESYSQSDYKEKLSGLNAFISQLYPHGGIVGRRYLYNQRETDNLHKAIDRKAVIIVREGGSRGNQEHALGMIYISELMKYARGRTSKHLVSVYLDEVHYYLSRPYADFLATSRESNFAQYIGFQSFGQLEALGQDVAKIIETNCRSWLAHNGLKPEDAEIVSNEVGKRTYIVFSESRKVNAPHEGVMQGSRLEDKSIMTPSMVQNISKSEVLFLTVEDREVEIPQLIIKPPYFDETKFSYTPPIFPDEIPLTVWEEEAEESTVVGEATTSPFIAPSNAQKTKEVQSQSSSKQQGQIKKHTNASSKKNKAAHKQEAEGKREKDIPSDEEAKKKSTNIIDFDDI